MIAAALDVPIVGAFGAEYAAVIASPGASIMLEAMFVPAQTFLYNCFPFLLPKFAPAGSTEEV
jgi:hypothetical protein